MHRCSRGTCWLSRPTSRPRPHSSTPSSRPRQRHGAFRTPSPGGRAATPVGRRTCSWRCCHWPPRVAWPATCWRSCSKPRWRAASGWMPGSCSKCIRPCRPAACAGRWTPGTEPVTRCPPSRATRWATAWRGCFWATPAPTLPPSRSTACCPPAMPRARRPPGWARCRSSSRPWPVCAARWHSPTCRLHGKRCCRARWTTSCREKATSSTSCANCGRCCTTWSPPCSAAAWHSPWPPRWCARRWNSCSTTRRAAACPRAGSPFRR